jgi:glycosyltransferase involved in cell wall biosynthesis
VRAEIIGGGPKREDLERIARDLGLSERVRFLGAVGQDDIRHHFAHADLFCLSSFAEGLPVVLMEAMAMGKPVVAPRIMGISEIVADGESGLLVPPARADLLADAIERLASEPQLRRRLGDRGRAIVEAEFDVRSEARRLRDLLLATQP